MAMFGYDIVESPELCCACKELNEHSKVFASMLFSYGTKADPFSICPDSHSRALLMTQRIIQSCGEDLLAEESSSDMTYFATKVKDALLDANTRIRRCGHYLGHGIYIGGVVSFLVGERYMVVPFGGARAYLWDGRSLVPRGEPAADGMIRDALGCTPTWTGSGWQGRLGSSGSIIALTHAPENLPELAEKIKRAKTVEDRNPNTVAMLLRSELQKQTNAATGAVEVWSMADTPSTV